MVFVEEFKACVPANIKTYTDEQRATTLHQVAILADNYSLTHKNAFPSTGGSGSRDDNSGTLPIHPKAGRHRYQHEGGRHDSGRSFNKSSGVVCNYCKKMKPCNVRVMVTAEEET